MELGGPVEIVKPHSLILKVLNQGWFTWLVRQSQSQCLGLLMLFQSPLPYSVLCHGEGVHDYS